MTRQGSFHDDCDCTQHSLTRREIFGIGLGAAAGMLALPAALDARIASFEQRAPRPDLEVAIKAARWIRRSRIETKDGAAWPADPLKPDSVGYDLYNGMPGIVLFHLELFYATGDRAWLEDARAGANELIARLSSI